MDKAAQPEPKAWQPITPRGVARFAHASTNRLIVVQLSIALIAAAAVVWFLAACYSPVIFDAIQKLPKEAEITKQQLHGLPPGALAENRFLSIGVESADDPFAGVGDLQIRLGANQVNICSLMGCVEIAYPAGWSISLARSSVEPRWGAWKPMILAGAGLVTVLFLVFTWGILNLVFSWVPKLIGFYADREVTWSGGWRLACAAHLPGALFVTVVIVLYGIGALDLIRFLIFFALHLPINWIYLVITPLFLPKLPGKIVKKNPFGNA